MKALLIGVYHLPSKKLDGEFSLLELEELAKTYSCSILYKELCHVRKTHPATYIGRGKAEALAHEASEADVILIDEGITPNQQKELEQVFKKPVLDRPGLIIEIFAQRAKSREAKLQVESAKIRYQLPRLKRLWGHLSRQRVGSGGGYLKGEGEKQIEIDRRLLSHKLQEVEKELRVVIQQRETQRKQRMKHLLPSFAIVGYTNAGKSSLMHLLTGAEVLVEDQLFATLDTTTRRFFLSKEEEALLVDTVGFIQKLPHFLIDAFKSTLEEACYCDVLIHVIDISHPKAIEQGKECLRVLEELGVKDKLHITLFNKVDLIENFTVLDSLFRIYPEAILFSVKEEWGVGRLLQKMQEAARKTNRLYRLLIPYGDAHLLNWLKQVGHSLQLDYRDEGIGVELFLSESYHDRVVKYEK